MDQNLFLAFLAAEQKMEQGEGQKIKQSWPQNVCNFCIIKYRLSWTIYRKSKASQGTFGRLWLRPCACDYQEVTSLGPSDHDFKLRYLRQVTSLVKILLQVTLLLVAVVVVSDVT